MNQTIFTIYDNKAKAFLKPFFTRNADTATRMIQELILTEPKHEFARYRADYELYEIGTYDDNSGVITSHPPAHMLNLNQLTWGEAPETGTATQAQTENYDHEAETLKAVKT